TFNNKSGGAFNTGSSVDLGGSGTLNNAGTLRLNGGIGAIGTVNLAGKYLQTSGGVLRTRAAWGTSTADTLAVTGTASLAGKLVVDPIWLPTTGGLQKTFTVLTADGGITNNGISITNTAVLTYVPLFPDANTMNVQATINFQGTNVNNLTPNQNAIGANLNTIFGGGTMLGFMPPLMQLSTSGELGNALNQLAPLGTGSTLSTALTSNTTFAQQLLSCRVVGEESESVRFIREGQCVWARINQRRYEDDGGTNRDRFHEDATFVSAGGQFMVAPDWRIGGGIGYETLDSATNRNAASQGDRLHLGGILKYNPGPWLLAASVTGGFGWHDNERNVAFDGFSASATSSNDSSFVSGRFTASYLMSQGAFYLRPQIEAAVTHLQQDGYSEYGTGGIALHVDETSDTVLSASSSLELGVGHRYEDGFVTRAFVKGGATFRDTDSFAATASFLEAPAGTPAFAFVSNVDKTVADVGAGIDLISQNGITVRLQYDGQFGDDTTLHSGGAKVGVKF
ncbi:MAG: autotransporter domain-containing protein, partial [Hyphomicrobium sp.]